MPRGLRQEATAVVGCITRHGNTVRYVADTELRRSFSPWRNPAVIDLRGSTTAGRRPTKRSPRPHLTPQPDRPTRLDPVCVGYLAGRRVSTVLPLAEPVYLFLAELGGTSLPRISIIITFTDPTVDGSPRRFTRPPAARGDSLLNCSRPTGRPWRMWRDSSRLSSSDATRT